MPVISGCLLMNDATSTVSYFIVFMMPTDLFTFHALEILGIIVTLYRVIVNQKLGSCLPTLQLADRNLVGDPFFALQLA